MTEKEALDIMQRYRNDGSCEKVILDALLDTEDLNRLEKMMLERKDVVCNTWLSEQERFRCYDGRISEESTELISKSSTLRGAIRAVNVKT